MGSLLHGFLVGIGFGIAAFVMYVTVGGAMAFSDWNYSRNYQRKWEREHPEEMERARRILHGDDHPTTKELPEHD